MTLLKKSQMEKNHI